MELPSPEALMSLFRERRSIRRYQPRPVPRELVQQLLEAGRWAPSASNRQPWAFIAVQDPAVIREVAKHAAYAVVRWAHVAEAPLLIMLCGDCSSRIYRRFLHEDIGLAGAQIMLQARALGLGTCWVGGLDRGAVSAVLRIPDHLEIVGLLTVGYPAVEPRPRPRKPLADLVHYDVYGNQDPEANVQAGKPRGGIWATVIRWFRFSIRV